MEGSGLRRFSVSRSMSSEEAAPMGRHIAAMEKDAHLDSWQCAAYV
jgi:hypothetical protein